MPTEATRFVLAVRAVLHGPAGELDAIEKECDGVLREVAARHGMAFVADFVKPGAPVGAPGGLAAGSDRAIAAVSKVIGVPESQVAEALKHEGAKALADLVDEHKCRRSGGYRDIPVST
jgi:hypothetical protein